MSKAAEIDTIKQLIVEGPDDRIVFDAMLNDLSISQVQVQEYKGKDKLGPFLKAFAKVSGFSNVVSLGIVRDADVDGAAAFQSVCDLLRNAGLHAPSAATAMDISNSLSVGVLIMPPNQSSGALETVLHESVQTDSIVHCADEFINCVDKESSQTLRHRDKGWVQAYVAGQGMQLADFVRLPGEGAHKGLWDFTSPAFTPVVQFLRGL